MSSRKKFNIFLGLIFGGREIDPQKMGRKKVQATKRLIEEAGGKFHIINEMKKIDFVGDTYKTKVNTNLGALPTSVRVGIRNISSTFSPKKRGKTVVFTKEAAIAHVRSFFTALLVREEALDIAEWNAYVKAETKAETKEEARVRVLPPKPLSLPTCIRMHVEECLKGKGSVVVVETTRQWCDARRATHVERFNLLQEVKG